MSNSETAIHQTRSVHRAKRTRVQRAADLAFIERHSLRGRTQSEIADLLAAERPYRVSRSQIAYDQDELKKHWLQSSAESFAGAKARALRELDAVLAEAWSAWEKSKAEGDVGSPALLRSLLEVHDRRVKLLGLHAAERVEISGPAGAPIEIESTEAQLPLDAAAKRALFERYMSHLAEEQKNEAINGAGEPKSS